MAKKRIAIIGEYFNRDDAQAGAPFAGFTGRFTRPILKSLGVDPRECLFTNVFNIHPSSGIKSFTTADPKDAIEDYPKFKAKSQSVMIHKKYQVEISRMFAEIERADPNVIIALGALPLWALYRSSEIKKYRGTPVIAKSGHKVLPTYHPLTLQGNWKLRPTFFSDIGKAVRESEFPELRRPSRIIWLEPTLDDIMEFKTRFLDTAQRISCDIETAKIKGIPTITEIGFAPSPDRAIVIPFLRREPVGNYWPTAQQEFMAWKLVEAICQIPQFGQNFNYDMSYIWGLMGIPIPRSAGDTMLLQHALYPELEKGLGYLASINTTEPSWKFMRTDNKSFKDEE